MISAKIIADSRSVETGARITTMELVYPRFIHSEFMTHRKKSRNASSSRAIPFMRSLKAIFKETAAPISWNANQPGMQGGKELTGWRRALAKTAWYGGLFAVTPFALLGHAAGLHKQVVNRMLEPWSHIRVVVTATDWENFLALRAHPDAQPEIRELAAAILRELRFSIPKMLELGEWHLPYIDDEDRENAQFYAYQFGLSALDLLIRASVARCARVSYRTFDGDRPTFANDHRLYTKLVLSRPMHASPAEHQATPDEKDGDSWVNPQLHGNLTGFIQYRKTLPGECATYEI